MNKFSKLFTTFRYAGLTKEETKKCLPEARKRNVTTLSWIIPFMLAVVCVLLVLSFFVESEKPNMIFYLVFVCVLLAQLLLFELYFKKHNDRALIMSYVFMLTAYAFGIYEATCLGENSSTALICVFLVAVPLLFIDTPIRLTVLTLVVEGALLLVYFLVDNPSPDRFLVIESAGCTLLAICYGYIIQKTKYSDIRNHLTIKAQRDTDILTGASSRIAYVRDLSQMNGGGSVTTGIVYADVNGLKKTNDTFGHQAGDALLKDAYSLLHKYFEKDNDRIYRIGRDEFVIISLGEDKESFDNRFKALFEDPQNEIVSLGSAWYETVGDAENSIREAEIKMYEEKDIYHQKHPDVPRRRR